MSLTSLIDEAGLTTHQRQMELKQMTEQIYHPTTPEEHKLRKGLAPRVHDAFTAFSKAVFADEALDGRTKQLIAVAVAHTTQCAYCIDGHTKLALRAGARPEEIMEAIWVAAEMRAGGAYAHSTLAMSAIAHESK